MRLNASSRPASGKHATAHRRKITNKEPTAPKTQILDSFALDESGDPPVEKPKKTLRPDDFVFLTDNRHCWLIRTAEIWFLEACGDQTRIQFPAGTVLIRRVLRDCERRLDATTFFRATPDCVINLTQVKQTRLLDSAHLLFLLPNGKEIVVSGSQNVLFRKIRAL